MILLFEIVGEQQPQYIPPPRSAEPYRMVKPSITVLPVAPVGDVTTLPCMSPSRVVTFTAQFLSSLVVSVPAKPPYNPAPSSSVIFSQYEPAATQTSPPEPAASTPAWTEWNA